MATERKSNTKLREKQIPLNARKNFLTNQTVLNNMGCFKKEQASHHWSCLSRSLLEVSSIILQCYIRN